MTEESVEFCCCVVIKKSELTKKSKNLYHNLCDKKLKPHHEKWFKDVIKSKKGIKK